MDELMLEYWTAHYAALPPSTFEAEDTEFDINQVIEDMGLSDDDWEDAPHLSTSL